ncbi:hypothetical protein [Pseudophaeobacter sp.]|uniref:hypothetical protein n=1 Tax=Pseudophaeobacter sp. TaxID=1971739 RepID=UPI003299A116
MDISRHAAVPAFAHLCTTQADPRFDFGSGQAMYRLYGLIAENTAHGKNARRCFSFSKQIKRLHRAKQGGLAAGKFFYPVIYELYYSYRVRQARAKPFFY